MSYQFTDVNAAANNAAGLQTIVDGTNLDTTLINFRTLNVTGRGIAERTLTETPKPYGDGSWVDFERIPARDLIIEAEIWANSETELQELFRKLNEEILGGEKKIIFTDDPNYYWLGYFTTWNAPKEDRRRHVITLMFRRADPYKYKTGTSIINNTTAVPAAYTMPITPEKITLIVGAATNSIKLTNTTTGKNIVLDRAFIAGDVIEIIYGESIRVQSSKGENMMPFVSLSSDLELFTIKAGDTLAATPTTVQYEITARGRSL